MTTGGRLGGVFPGCRRAVWLPVMVGSSAVLGAIFAVTSGLVPSGSWDVRGLVGPHFPPGDDRNMGRALQQLFGDANVRAEVHAWMRTFVLVDALLFVPAYGLGLYCWLELLRRRMRRQVGAGHRLAMALALSPALADQIENALTWLLLSQAVAHADANRAPGATEELSATPLLLAATAAKWLLLTLAVLTALGVHIAIAWLPRTARGSGRAR